MALELKDNITPGWDGKFTAVHTLEKAERVAAGLQTGKGEERTIKTVPGKLDFLMLSSLECIRPRSQ